MKAIVLEKPGQFRCVETDEPAQPGAGEALVQVHRVGICGTDISGYLGKFPFYSYPRIPGHELGVEVLAIGPDVANVKPGDRCSVEPYINCQTCSPCRLGRPNCCQNLKVLGVHTDGGMRSRVILPARKLHPSEKLTLDQLALVETLAIGCHAVDRGAPAAGEHVLVIGAGPIGLSILEFVKLTGARITVLDLNAERLEFCSRTMGVQHTLQPLPDRGELKTLEEIDGGALPAVVFDATGNAQVDVRRVPLRRGTPASLFSSASLRPTFPFRDPLFHLREMTLFGSRNAMPEDFGRIIRLIEDGQIDTRPWITHRTPFARPDRINSRRSQAGNRVIKAMVDVD